MSGWTKLFSSIIDSSVWQEDDKTRLVWVTMLAKSDRHGMVESSVPGLAHAAHVSLEDCLAALKKLSDPDPYSRSKEYEGRRIAEAPGGWTILNRAKYRDEDDRARRTEYQRLKQKEYREKKRAKPEPAKPPTPQQAVVQKVIDAWPWMPKPKPALVALWVKILNGADPVISLLAEDGVRASLEAAKDKTLYFTAIVRKGGGRVDEQDYIAKRLAELKAKGEDDGL